MKYVGAIIVLGWILGVSVAADGPAVYGRYRAIIDDQGKTTKDRQKDGRQFLQSLPKTEFLAFVRETAREARSQHPEIAEKEEFFVLMMVMIAQNYVVGAGCNEPILETLAQISDSTLPASWKIALLDVVKVENRSDLSEIEVAEVTKILAEKAQSKKDSEPFRLFYAHRLGSFLLTQREIIMQKSPELKDALEKQDRIALPKRDDANVKQAAKLIDAIRDYRAALQKMADEVKEEKTKDDLKKHLTKWEPAPVTPIK